jgi:hypothetical protein
MTVDETEDAAAQWSPESIMFTLWQNTLHERATPATCQQQDSGDLLGPLLRIQRPDRGNGNIQEKLNIQISDICDLVFRVPGYRSKSPAFNSRRHQTF